METIGLPELLVVGLVAVLLFGTAKIPQAAKGLGEAIRNFKSSVKDETQEIRNDIEKV
jgi:sec-independent protein translocase protein TatA